MRKVCHADGATSERFLGQRHDGFQVVRSARRHVDLGPVLDSERMYSDVRSREDHEPRDSSLVLPGLAPDLIDSGFDVEHHGIIQLPHSDLGN